MTRHVEIRAITVCALVAIGLVAGTTTSSQANSVLARALTFDHSGTACASVDSAGDLASTATQTGVAFDGTRLLLSCWNDNTITAVLPVDGSQLATYHITGGGGFGALTWDPTRSVLWACNGHKTEVGTIDLTTSKFTPVFMALGCTDALAYDPSDDTLWAGRDGGHSVATVEHYTTQGTLLSSANVGGLVNDRAGLAIAGSRVYMASPWSGFPKHIWQTTRSFSSANVIMTWTGGAKVEDLECDGTTFSSPVMWAQWNHQNILKAYSIGGTCGPPAGAELTTTQTPSASRVTADSELRITTKITNLGPVVAPNATATVTLPPTTVITAATPSRVRARRNPGSHAPWGRSRLAPPRLSPRRSPRWRREPRQPR